MTRINEIDRPGIPLRLAYRIGERMFGRVPTPERIMAHRPPLMLGLGGLYGAIEWFAKIVRDDQDVTHECFARVREHFTESEVLELTFIVGSQTFAGKFAKAFRLAPQGFAG